jgi:hypothetical protein
MNIGPDVIGLPDFDQSAAYRLPAGIEHPAADPGDFTHCGRDVVMDDQEVVVLIQRKLVREIRTFGLGRRQRQRLGKGSPLGEEQASQAQRGQEFSAVGIG